MAVVVVVAAAAVVGISPLSLSVILACEYLNFNNLYAQQKV